MATIQLASTDARLAYLALQYHLSRPGSELDPETKEALARGLAGVARELEPQLEGAVATVELDGEQQRRLLEAVSGAMNELKSYPLLAAGGRPMAPAFHEALRRLFPEVAEEPDEAVALAGHMLALRRRLERVDAGGGEDAPEPAGRKPWWRVWGR